MTAQALMERMVADRRARYNAELAKGLHDDNCEQRDRFWICHCSKRARIAKGVTDPPELINMYPVCAGCDREVYHDGDSFRCDNCHVSWPAGPETPGEFTDDHGDLSEDGDRWGSRLIESVRS